MTDEWECDGQDFTGTLAEVNAHILEQDVDFDDLSTIKCWGAMQVGGNAWLDFHVLGVHPMSAISARW